MMLELLAAAAVGLTFANAWMCMLMSFGCTGDHLKVGLRFIAGRFIGLIALGVAISLIGAVADIPPLYFVAIFGAASIAFGVLMYLGLWSRAGGRFDAFKRWVRRSLQLQRGDGCNRRMGDRLRNEGAFLLGVSRGATPCLKTMVLAPLLIASGPLLAILITLVYAVASTIYPVIGFLVASSIHNVPKYERALKFVGGTTLILVGIYAIGNEWLMYLARGPE